jgi:hypothetical protein
MNGFTNHGSRPELRRASESWITPSDPNGWCNLVSEAMLFVYGIYIPEDHLWNASVAGKLDPAHVKDAYAWAQQVIVWKTHQSDDGIWPGHITPALWPLFWEVALQVDRERAMKAIGHALTDLAYREYDAAKDWKPWSGTATKLVG